MLWSQLSQGRHFTQNPLPNHGGLQMSAQYLSTYSRWTKVSSDLLVAISPRNVTHLIHLVEKFSKHPLLLDPQKVAEAAQLKSLTGTLLKKGGVPQTKSSREKLWSTIELTEEEASHRRVEEPDKRWGCNEEESF